MSSQPSRQEAAILETLAYSDIFDYPLRLEELQRFLHSTSLSGSEIVQIRKHSPRLRSRVGETDGYYFLAGRETIVAIRKERETFSEPVFVRALRYGRIIGRLPFIRMAALTGSLAMRNCDRKADIDFMLVTVPGRLWLARGFVLLVARLAELAGDTLCPNLIVSESTLDWGRQDLYSAHELCQMVPVSGFEVYYRLREANPWTAAWLPNAGGAPLPTPGRQTRSRWQSVLESVLRGGPGDRLEIWEQRRKIDRLTRLNGSGSETAFSADLCQGHFHHHGADTLRAFQDRCEQLGLWRRIGQ